MKKLFLLDAVIVIKAHELNRWRAITSQSQIALPSIVLQDEARYFRSERSGFDLIIDLSTDIAKGVIEELEATAEDISLVRNKFDRIFIEKIDAGELEALSLIDAGKCNDYLFCTADAPAIQALSMLGHSESGISFEKLLSNIGFQQKELSIQYTQSFFKRNIETGSKNLVTGHGLA